MADARDQADVSPASSPRASLSTSEPSRTDTRTAQDGPTTDSNSQSTFQQTHAQSEEALLSRPMSGDESVTVERPDPQAGFNAPRRRVTVRRDNTQSQRQSAVPQQSGGNAVRPQGGAQKSQTYRFVDMLGCWLLELFAILLAAITVVILVVLLSYYHDRSVRAWNHEWAINSV
jgi:hypothetical protein